MFGKNSISHKDIDVYAGHGLLETTLGGTTMSDEKRNSWPGTDYQSQIYHDPNQKGPKKE